MNIKLITLSALLGLVVVGFFTLRSVSAKECRSVYGGGEVCEYGDITIDKQIWNPNKSEYWDNIDASDYVFGPQQEITFRIRIKNISDVKQNHIALRDFMTDYLTFVRASDNANWLSDQKKAEWSIDNLEPGQTKTVEITFKTVVRDQIPSGKTQLVNRAEAQKDNGERKSDSSYFYIAKDKSVTPAVLGDKMPDTGVSLPVLLGLEIVSLGGLGGGFLIAASRRRQSVSFK